MRNLSPRSVFADSVQTTDFGAGFPPESALHKWRANNSVIRQKNEGKPLFRLVNSYNDGEGRTRSNFELKATSHFQAKFIKCSRHRKCSIVYEKNAENSLFSVVFTVF